MALISKVFFSSLSTFETPPLQGACGPGYRAVLDQALPGAFAQHVADADTFFGQEQPALQQGRSRGRTRVASPSRSWRSSERRVRRCSPFGARYRHCSSTGCPMLSPSSCPMRRTCSRCKILVAWRRGWRPFLLVTRFRPLPEQREDGCNGSNQERRRARANTKARCQEPLLQRSAGRGSRRARVEGGLRSGPN